MALLFQLIVGHALSDFALQRQVMAIAKSRHADIHNTSGKGFPPWYYWLLAHALIHGGAVYLVTGSAVLGAIETLLHSIIDFSKCENWINFHQDQALHLICKLAYCYFI